MPYLKARDGQKLHYWDVGRGPTCVLLHGFAMHAYLWLPYVAPLTYRYRFILPDLRGFGGSHAAPIGTSNALVQYADDLEDLLAGLNLDGCALAGLSMGACTAMEYQRRYGFSRVRAYLNIDTPPCVTGKPGWPWGLFGERYIEFRSQLLELLQDLSGYPALTQYPELPRRLRLRMWRQLSEFAIECTENPLLRRLFYYGRHESLVQPFANTRQWRVYVDLMRTFIEGDHDWRGSVPRTEQRLIRVFAGTESRVFPFEGQRYFEKLVPSAEIVRFDGAGHCLQFDAPTRFIRELGRFLADAGRHPYYRPLPLPVVARA